MLTYICQNVSPEHYTSLNKLSKHKTFLALPKSEERRVVRKDPLESIDSGNKVLKVFNEIFEIEE